MTRQALPQYPEPAHSPNDTISRRRFVLGGSSAVAILSAGVLGGCATLAVRQVQPVNGQIELVLAQYPELAEQNGALRLRVGDDVTPIYVLASGARQFTALSPVCTHLGCTVDIQGSVLVCPCHGSTYDRAGAVVRGPAERPLRRYRATVASDQVLVIDLAADFQRNG